MHTTLICDTENDRTYNNNQNPLKKRYVTRFFCIYLVLKNPVSDFKPDTGSDKFENPNSTEF